MIALLRGRLVTGGAGDVVVDVGGVGYEVLVMPGDVRAAIGSEVTLHTHLAVREDALTLYGFTNPAAVSLFRQLLGVSGVGPKLALAAVGTLGPEGLRRAVVAEDVAALTAIPGVGRKGAQRMILELRERLGALGVNDLPGVAAAGGHDARADVRVALDALGYGAAEIDKVLADLPGGGEGAPREGSAGAGAGAEELLREALRALGRR